MIEEMVRLDFDERIREIVRQDRIIEEARDWKRREQRRKRTHTKNRKNVRMIAKSSRRNNR